MAPAAKAVLVDGPRRGETVPLDGPCQVSCAMLVLVRDASERATVVYRIHRVALFGERLLVGSTRDKGPCDYDLWVALASAAAKDAALR